MTCASLHPPSTRIMDGDVGFRANMVVNDNAILQKADQALMVQQGNINAIPKYRCGDCGHINELKLQDAIRCRMCGFRVLYNAMKQGAGTTCFILKMGICSGIISVDIDIM